MLRMYVSLNQNFIRNTDCVVVVDDVEMDIREANIREMVRWFEQNLRDWVAR